MTSVITGQEMGQLWVLFSHPEMIHCLILFMGFPGGSVVKNSVCQCRRRGFDPWSRQSLGGGNGNPLHCSCLGNPMDGGAWRATQSMELQRVGHDLATEHHHQILFISVCCPKTVADPRALVYPRGRGEHVHSWRGFVPTVLALALARFLSACWPGPGQDCLPPGGCPPACSPTCHLHPAFTPVFQKLERESRRCHPLTSDPRSWGSDGHRGRVVAEGSEKGEHRSWQSLASWDLFQDASGLVLRLV